MKKILILLVAIGFSNLSFGQFVCGQESSPDNRLSGYIANGGVFTPKGDLRVLVIFVTYGGIYDTLNMDGWSGTFPDWATSSTEKAFYNDFSEFSQDVFSDNNRKSVSNFYYQMSNGQFRLVADYYPQVITVDPTTASSRGDFHKKVLEQIPNSFDWSRYDNRTNAPNYSFDNSNSSSDDVVDYVVFCHRFSRKWESLPHGWLEQIYYDGEASLGIYNLYDLPFSSVMKIRDGFTQMNGGIDPIGIFVHELGHKIYDGPHYSGENNVCGNYFYEPIAGWGMMRTVYSYPCATGWERYVLDWTNQIKANGINSDIASYSDLTATNGIFTLRDFITTGDAIRIRVSAENGVYQYLWLENHQCVSTFDGNVHGALFCSTEIDQYKPGLVAYVESYSHVKDGNTIDLSANANGIRWLSHDGDYDFTFDPNPIHPEELCRNVTYQMFRGDPNPIGGQNINESIRHDFDNDGSIGYISGGGTASHRNEQAEVVQLDNDYPTAKYITGTGMQFQVGDKVSISTNPCVKNIPQYDSRTYTMKEYYLNGISFEILSQNPDGSMVVKVKVDDVSIENNSRFAAASIVLGDITGDNRPDIDVQQSITLDIDKSGTPNRHKNLENPNQLSSTISDFITPTTFVCLNNSYFKQQPNSKVNVIENSTLELESGSVYEVGNGAELNINDGATLIIKTGATLHVKGQGRVEIGSTGYICIENGANIVLDDALSVINLRPGYHSGVNPTVHNEPVSSCSSTPLQYYPHTGSGSINLFNLNRYIQNTNFLNSTFCGGNEIYAGHHVTNQTHYGNVVVQNIATVIFDSTNGVHLDAGFEVKLGAKFEVR